MKLARKIIASVVTGAMLISNVSAATSVIADQTESTETEVVITETTESNETSETSLETTANVVIDDTSETSSEIEYIEETEDLIETEVTVVTEEEVISSETNTDPTEEAEYEFSVVLPDNQMVSVEDTVSIVADVVATKTVNGETTDLDYSFEFAGVGVNFSDAYSTQTEVSFTAGGVYVITGMLIVDGEIVASDDMVITVDSSSSVEITTAADMDDFLELVSQLPSSNRVIVCTSDDISDDIENATGVYFDGVYVISFENTDSYTEAISLFSSRGISYCIDAVVEANGFSSESFVRNAELNIDGSVRVAIIDTGSNLANESYSVIGDETADDNGHGTRMAELILDNDADNAYIISIKALGADGHGSIVDVYNAVQLALDLDVDYILMSFSTINSTEYTAFRELLTEANDSGVNVVASAGNNGMNASFYIPASVSAVTTVGSLTEYYTKQPSSNYGPCVDYYVIADSTSDAAAIYVGYTLSGNTEKVFTTYLDDSAILSYGELYDQYSAIAREITADLIATYGYGECRLEIDENGEFVLVYVFEGVPSSDVVINARPDSDLVNYSTNTIGESPVPLTDGMSGTDRGTASFAQSTEYPGYGVITGISSVATTGSGLTLSQFTSSMNVACSRAYGYESSRHATPIPDGPVDYEATYSVSGGTITWTVKVGAQGTDISQPVWSNQVKNIPWSIELVTSATTPYYRYTVDGVSHTALVSEFSLSMVVSACRAVIADVEDAYADDFGKVNNLTWSGLPTGTGSGTAVARWTATDDTQVFMGTLTSDTPTFNYSITFNKVDTSEAHNNLSGAVINFVCVSGEGVGHENELVVTRGATGVNSCVYNGYLGWQFTTTGQTVYIEGLRANSTYMFHEAQVPTNPSTGMPYERADDIYVTVGADGTCSPASVTMYDDSTTTNGDFGSFSIIKTWTGSDVTSNYFWDSVDSINFGLYGIGFTADDARRYFVNGNGGGLTQLAGGTLNRPSGSSTSSSVYWNYFDPNALGNPIRGADPEWYHWAYTVQTSPTHMDLMTYTVYGQENQYGIRHDGTSYFIGMPRERYFMVTETWSSYRFDGEVEDYYINQMNNSGWHAIYNSDGSYRYAAIYYIGRNGVTYICDWDSLNPIRALTLHPSPTGDYYYDEYYYDEVDNEEATGSLDVVKIDETGLGVDGVRFELRSGDNPDNVLGTGTIGNSIGQINGFNAYNVLWNYALIKPGYIRWQYPYGTNSGPDDNDEACHMERQTLGPAYNIRDLVPYGDMNRVLVQVYGVRGQESYWTANEFLARYRDFLQWQADGEPHPYTGGVPINSQYLYNYSNDLWYGIAALRSEYVTAPIVYPRNFGLGPNFNIENGNLNEIRETDAEFVAHLNYGDYYIYEYIEDANGNNIIGTNGYETPEGWTAYDGNNDGVPEYFYIRVTVGEEHMVNPLTVNCANSVLGKIDVTKVSLTGGPLSDLSFEVRNSSGEVIATGYIPADATPETTGTGTATDYTYSATWDYTRNGTTITGVPIVSGVGLGNFTVREYIPVSAVENRADLDVSSDWTYGGVTTHNGVASYFFTKTIVIDDTNASELQVATITNAVSPSIGTTLTDFADRHITVVGENIEFTDVVAYEGCYIGATYVMHATLVDQNGNAILDSNGNPYSGETTFTTTSGSGTIPVTFTVNTADIVEATLQADGTVHYAARSVVCFESMRLVGNYEIANHNDVTDSSQTVEIPNPEIGTQFCDVLTQEHDTVTGRIVQVRDICSYTNLHVGETYTLTCHLYDQSTGNALRYSNGDEVEVTQSFVCQRESGTVNVDFTIDTSDLQVNVFAYDDCTLVAFEYLRTASGILIGGHTDIDDVEQYLRPHLPSPRTSFIDDQTGSRIGRLGSEVPFTDHVYLNNLNIGESYQLRARVVSSDNTSRVWAYEVVDFTATAREMTVDVHFIIDTSEICAGSNEANIVCFEQLWQLDTQNTGRGEVFLAGHEDVRDQDQTIQLRPEIGTTVLDDTTNSQYSMIGDSVSFTDYVEYHRLHIGETYTVNGVLMDHQTGQPVLDRNGQQITGSTTFVPTETDGIVEVHFTFDSLYLVEQIGQTINGVTVESPRELVVYETIRSSTNYDFEIHAELEDQLQTLILGSITSHAGDLQTSTAWLSSGLTTLRDTVHYIGLGPVEYTLRGSLHLVDYDANGNPIDGGLISAQAGEVTQLEQSFTPSNNEGNVSFDFKIDSNRFQGRNIVVFEELWLGNTCIVSHENYSDSYGNFGMYNLDQTVHVASVWTSAFSFQSGEQLLAYDTEAKVTDFVYYGNVEVGQDYYCEASLWACYTDEAGQIHSVAISQADGGVATSPVFRATENHGIAEVTFTIDSTKLFDEHYDYLLVSERLIHVGSGVCIATHSDLTSKEQSINIPDLHTTATTAAGHTLPEGENPDIVPVTITDRVYYENLIPGKSYTVVGNLQYARTDANGNITESGALMQNGQPVTATKTFVPEASTGYIDLEFTVNAADIFAHNYDRIVAFEDLYFGPEGIRVGVHADITDQEQTITPPDLQTTALGRNGRHNVQATANTEIIDTVVYSGLTPGREYRLETDLMSSKTGTSIAHVTTTFVPTTPDGVVTVSMTADLTGYGAGDKVVVFENCYDNGTGILIRSHMDWNDENQTVETGGGGDTGILDDSSNRFLYAAMACFAALIGLGGYTLVQKRRKNDEVDPTGDAKG